MVHESNERLMVRQNILQPVHLARTAGVMVTVSEVGGTGYAATADLSPAGLRAAFDSARAWARRIAGRTDVPSRPDRVVASGSYASRVAEPWARVPRHEKIERLTEVSASLQTDARVVDWSASLWHTATDSRYVDSLGARIEQRFQYLVPDISVTASDHSVTETRSFGGYAHCRQGGLEILRDLDFDARGAEIAQQALELLGAPNCPDGTMDVVLAPDQMILQIHESIGHPLELDRIYGDERNYAGTSFVTPDMFGQYQYGSDLLNVTFAPDVVGEFASFGFDDEGTPAKREHLIQNGLLVRGLGGARSQLRTGLDGVANARACSWNRAPIDRMANLNLEPGTSSFDDLIGAVDDGVFMETNISWSIDDSRNKFQFGCERARLIRHGELGPVVRKPNYRGVSATFWRSLDGVGNAATSERLGTPFCGKGEPNQCVRVGHATPACRFRQVEVFGGE
ncbi:MAG: TldD/PmbA family protein [Pseudomonadota bacterium]